LESSACIGKPKNNDENGFFYFSKKIRGTKNALNLSSEPVDKLFILNQSALNESFQKTKDFLKATSKKFIDQTSNFVMKFKAPSKLNNSISDFKAYTASLKNNIPNINPILSFKSKLTDFNRNLDGTTNLEQDLISYEKDFNEKNKENLNSTLLTDQEISSESENSVITVDSLSTDSENMIIDLNNKKNKVIEKCGIGADSCALNKLDINIIKERCNYVAIQGSDRKKKPEIKHASCEIQQNTDHEKYHYDQVIIFLILKDYFAYYFLAKVKYANKFLERRFTLQKG